MRVPRPRTLRGQLVAVAVLAAIALGSIGSVLLVASLRRGAQTALDAALRNRSRAAVVAVRAPGPVDVSDVLNGTAPDAAELLVLYRPDGSVAAARPRPPGRALLSDRDLVRAHAHEVAAFVAGSHPRMRVIAAPALRSDGPWVVVVGADLASIESSARQLVTALLLAMPLAIALVGVGAWLLAGAALRPVERMRADAARQTDDAGPALISVPRTSTELVSLATTFNGLLERVQASAARQRQLVADASHELRTPLAVLRAELELASRARRPAAEVREAVRHAHAEVERLSGVAADLLFLAHADGGELQVEHRPVATRELLESAVRAVRASAAEQGTEIHVDAGPALTISGDAAALRRALDNVLANALQSSRGGKIRLDARHERTEVVLSVTDDGPGFDPVFLPHATERFRRADASRHEGGAGLGLSIAAEILRAHGGRLELANGPVRGAVVQLRLAAAAEPTIGSPGSG